MIDMRSDTVTQPTAAMREAMARAPLGDDVFRDDPSVLGLERAVASFLGKESAVFVPTGTMANQIAIRLHTRHGDEVIAHAGAHLYNYESGAQAALAGIAVRPVHSSDGTLPADQVAASLHLSDDPHYAPTAMIAFENTHNQCGGRVVPLANVEEIAVLAERHGIPMHLDGARLANTLVATGKSATELCARFATVSICFSKGLGAPVGSVLAGSNPLMKQAIRYRKMYGGGMRQAGVLAAAAHYALENHLEDLERDHRNARLFASTLASHGVASLDLETVETNLVYFSVGSGRGMGNDGDVFLNRVRAAGVLLTGGAGRYRAVMHRDLTDPDVVSAARIVCRVLDELKGEGGV